MSNVMIRKQGLYANMDQRRERDETRNEMRACETALRDSYGQNRTRAAHLERARA